MPAYVLDRGSHVIQITLCPRCKVDSKTDRWVWRAMRTAIIGGGIAGLAAAYELEEARRAGAPVEYALYEAAERLGGVLASEIVNGAVLERGPDSFLTEKPAAAELCREVGLA